MHALSCSLGALCLLISACDRVDAMLPRLDASLETPTDALTRIDSSPDSFNLAVRVWTQGVVVDQVIVSGSAAQVSIEPNVVNIDIPFESYVEAIDFGPVGVNFLRQGEPLGMGSVIAGQCRNCLASSCPSDDEIQVERFEFNGTSFEARGYTCYECDGGNGVIRACI